VVLLLDPTSRGNKFYFEAQISEKTGLYEGLSGPFQGLNGSVLMLTRGITEGIPPPNTHETTTQTRVHYLSVR